MKRTTHKRKGIQRINDLKHRKKIIVSSFIILFAGISAYSIFIAAALTPQGTYTNWNWSPPANGYSSLKHTLTIQAVTTNAPYFWSHQYQFLNGDGGYIGLQSNGNRVDGTVGKTAIFSIFSAGIAATPGACQVQQAGFDGYNTSGSSCRVAYDWVIGRTYQMRTAIISKDSTGTWWGGWVKDMTTGTETFIAQIKTPATWNGIGSWSSMWTEYFGTQPSTCDALAYSKVTFGQPTADDTVVPYSTSNYLSTTADCKTSSVSNTTAGYVQVMGNPLNYSDITLPIVTMAQPTQGTTYTAPVSISGTATDNLAVSSMDILIDNTVVKTAAGNSISMSWTPPAQKTKTTKVRQFTVSIRAKDAAGNIGSKSVTIYVK